MPSTPETIKSDIQKDVRHLITLTVVLVVLLGGLAVGGWVKNRHDVLAAKNLASQSLHKAQLNTCARVQRLRDQVNGNTFLIYNHHTLDAQYLKGEAKRKALAVRDKLYVVPPTNCHQAIDNPKSYRAAKPVRISKGGPQVEALRERANKTSGQLPR